MTQWQYDTILKIVENSTPGLYQELGGAMSKLVQDFNALAAENKALKEAKSDSPEEKEKEKQD